jgi:hypothetical protein
MYLRYYHDDTLYDEAEIVRYDPPRGFDVQVSEAPFFIQHTEHQAVPPRLTLRLSKMPDRSQYVSVENAAGERVNVLVEHIEGNEVVVGGLFDDRFIEAAFGR